MGCPLVGSISCGLSIGYGWYLNYPTNLPAILAAMKAHGGAEGRVVRIADAVPFWRTNNLSKGTTMDDEQGLPTTSGRGLINNAPPDQPLATGPSLLNEASPTPPAGTPDTGKPGLINSTSRS